MPLALRAIDFRRLGAIGQIQRHQRLELRIRRQRGEDSLAVGQRQRSGRDRRLEIGHDDGAREARRREGQHRAQCRAIPQVQMPVVGAAQVSVLTCGARCSGRMSWRKRARACNARQSR